MRYYKNIILEDTIKDIKIFVNKGIGIFNYYAVCVSCSGNGLMEILSLGDAIKSVNNYKDYGIIAVVKGKTKAQRVAASLIEKWLEENENTDGFKEYYNIRCR